MTFKCGQVGQSHRRLGQGNAGSDEPAPTLAAVAGKRVDANGKFAGHAHGDA